MIFLATKGAGSPGLSLDASIRNAALNLGGGGALDSWLSCVDKEMCGYVMLWYGMIMLLYGMLFS